MGWIHIDSISTKLFVNLMDDRIGEFRYLRRKDILDTLYDALPPETVKFGYQLESIKLDSNTNKPVLRFVNGNTIIAKVLNSFTTDNLSSLMAFVSHSSLR